MLFSDGVSEGRRGADDRRRRAQQDLRFILRNYSSNVSTQRMKAASILSTVKTLDMDAMHDNTTVVVARLHEALPVRRPSLGPSAQG